MTIVASNSVTLSNVNDGTITHTAYSWSANGTDRFTTVYPNLNLLVNSSAKIKAGFFKYFDKVENGYGELTRKGNNSYAGIRMWDGFSIQPGDYKPGDTYTMSMDVMFTSWNFPAGVYLEEFWIGQRYTHNSDWSINSWKRICYIDLPKDPSKMLNQWIRITYTSTIPPHEDPSVHTESIFLTKFSGSGEASFTLRIRNPKQEPGSIATPHMPSSSEVTTADWPKYIGHYTDFMQADSTNPSDYTWGPMRGEDGVGVTSTVITYAISTSGTTAPSTGWTSSVPGLVKGQYLWTKTLWTYTDTSSKTAYSVSYNSKDGTNGTNGTSGIIVSSVAPDSPQNGQLWQDISTIPQLIKKWTGNEWVIWEFYAENIKATTLETLSAIIGKLKNTYTVDYGAGVHTGTVTIENGMKIVDDSGISRTTTDFTSQSSGQGMFARHLPDKSDSAKYQQAWYTPFSLRFDDTVNGWHGQITAEALHNKGWKNVTGFINGVQTDTVPLQYKVTINMDNTRTIKFRGGFKGSGTSDIPQAGIVQLPAEARPTTTIAFPCMGSGARIARIIISTDGWIQFNVANGFSISGFNAVLLSNVFYEI